MGQFEYTKMPYGLKNEPQNMEEKCEYLGYIISKEGIKQDKKNIEANTNFPMPKNTKDVHSFLEYAHILENLLKNSLSKQNRCTISFEKMHYFNSMKKK